MRAPLSTLVLNDEDDELYTPAEMRRAEGILAEVFKKAECAIIDTNKTNDSAVPFTVYFVGG